VLKLLYNCPPRDYKSSWWWITLYNTAHIIPRGNYCKK